MKIKSIETPPEVATFLSLDAFRGIAALWVVMDHACVPYITGEGALLKNSPIYFLSSFGSLGVVMFFVLSGYCIAGAVYKALANGRTPLQFARDRILRIYPPYIATCILAVFIGFALNEAQRFHLIPRPNHQMNLKQGWDYWFANASITQIECHQPFLVIVFWSLCYEIVFYAVMGCLFAAFRPLLNYGFIPLERTSRFFSLVIFLITSMSLGWLIINPTHCPFPLDLWYQFGIGALLFFAMLESSRDGRSFSRLTDPRWHLGITFFVLFLFSIFRNITFVNGLALHEFVVGKPSTRIQTACALFFVILLILIRPFDRIAARLSLIRPLSSLGTISYSLYLTHTLVQPFFDSGLRRLGFSGSLYILTFLVEVVISIVFGFIFYRLIECHFISPGAKKRLIRERIL